VLLNTQTSVLLLCKTTTLFVFGRVIKSQINVQARDLVLLTLTSKHADIKPAPAGINKKLIFLIIPTGAGLYLSLFEYQSHIFPTPNLQKHLTYSMGNQLIRILFAKSWCYMPDSGGHSGEICNLTCGDVIKFYCF